MPLARKALARVAAACLFFAVVYGQTHQVVGPKCLACLCEGSTRCNVSVGCEAPFPGGYYCGPFLISQPYWIDADSPVIKDDSPKTQGAFERCVNDVYCAAETVSRYITKFVTGSIPGLSADCNRDGLVNCHDFAYMHRMGAYDCNDPSTRNSEFYRRFATCWKVVTDASKPDTEASKPVAGASKQVSGASKPVTDASKLVTDVFKPVTGASKTVTDASKPVTGAFKLATNKA